MDEDMPTEGQIAIDTQLYEDEDDEEVVIVEEIEHTPHQSRLSEPDPNNIYESPFKHDPEKLNSYKNSTQYAAEPDLEFPDKDIQMKIRDKDVVFIYEIDDIIKEYISPKGDLKIDEGTEIVDILNRYSKLFRHYIRYRVVEIGDLIGGLFLDGFWKTLLITIDKILMSVDQKCKQRVYKMHQQYEKLNEVMHKRLAEKDQEMRLMDMTDLVNDLERKLKLIKDEKKFYQELAQDKSVYLIYHHFWLIHNIFRL